MELQALHHITMITGDARRNVEFYAGLLGLRLVKQTVNFDRPSAYHLYFGDETGAPGSLLTWFEFPRARPGQAGDGAIHTIALVVAENPPLRAEHPEIPAEHAIGGIEGARGYGTAPPESDPWLTGTLGFTHVGGGEYRLAGGE